MYKHTKLHLLHAENAEQIYMQHYLKLIIKRKN